MNATIKSDRHDDAMSIWTLEISEEDIVGRPQPTGKVVTYIALPTGTDLIVIDGEIHDALILMEQGSNPIVDAVGRALMATI